jgi:hypothetical protein
MSNSSSNTIGEKWEYTVSYTRDFSVYREDTPEPNKIWEQQYKDGTTDFDNLQKHGSQGWELVSAVSVGRKASQIVLFYKRRVR